MPEVNPADGAGFASNDNHLAVDVVLMLLVIAGQGRLPGPSAGAGAVEVKLVLPGRICVTQCGDHVRVIAVAAQDADMGVIEREGGLREQLQGGPPLTRSKLVNEILIPSLAGRDAEEDDVGFRGDDIGRGGEWRGAGAADLEGGDAGRGGGAQGDLDVVRAAPRLAGGGGGVAAAAGRGGVDPQAEEEACRKRISVLALFHEFLAAPA